MGASGRVEDFLAWNNFYTHLKDFSFPKENPKLSQLLNSVAQNFDNTKEFSLVDVRKVLEELTFLEIAEYQPKLRQYAPLLHKVTLPAQNYFFVHKDETFLGIQLTRSIFLNLLTSLRERESRCQNFAIAVTEAIENAVKFSTHDLIVVEYRLKNYLKRQIIEIYIINGSKQISSNSAQEEKFSENSSLMRGVLVMSSLLDNVNIRYNEEWKQMEFSASYKLANIK